MCIHDIVHSHVQSVYVMNCLYNNDHIYLNAVNQRSSAMWPMVQ